MVRFSIPRRVRDYMIMTHRCQGLIVHTRVLGLDNGLCEASLSFRCSTKTRSHHVIVEFQLRFTPDDGEFSSGSGPGQAPGDVPHLPQISGFCGACVSSGQSTQGYIDSRQNSNVSRTSRITSDWSHLV